MLNSNIVASLCSRLKKRFFPVVFLIIFINTFLINKYLLKNIELYIINDNNTNLSKVFKFVHDTKTLPVYENENLKNEFWNIIKNDCDSFNLKSDRSCLEKVSDFNNRIDYSLESKDNCNECSWLNNDKINYHVFWQTSNYDPKSFKMRVMFLNIMSYLATQNLCCTKLIFWKLPIFPTITVDILNAVFKNYISIGSLEIRTFDLGILCSNKLSSFKDESWCTSTNLGWKFLVGLSDFVRIFVLDIYGGIYTDGDVIYLNDMKIFWDSNFAFRWSFINKYNTAVMGINNRNDSNLKSLIDYLRVNFNDVNSMIKAVHPHSIADIIKDKLGHEDIFHNSVLNMLHSSLFDPAWLCNDKHNPRLSDKFICAFEEFTNREFINASEFSINSFSPGSFAYHIHLRDSNKNIRKNSYFSHFEAYFASVLHLNKIKLSKSFFNFNFDFDF